MTLKGRRPEWLWPKKKKIWNEDNLKNEDALEIKDDPKTEDDLKWRWPQKRGNLNQSGFGKEKTSLTKRVIGI